jgi:DedD protein
MAKAVTEEQVQLRRRARRRLVGAIALVTVIAVVLPWVLDNEPPPTGSDVSVQIPSPNAGEFTSRVAPPEAPPRPGAGSDAKADPKPSGAAESKPAPEPKPAAESKAAPDRKPVAQPTDPAAGPETLEAEQQRSLTPPVPKRIADAEKAKAAKASPKPPEKPADKPAAAEPKAGVAAKGTDRGYVVQIGALADAEKAKGLQQQLAAKGLPAYTEVVDSAKGKVTRVRVGPFPSREAADQSRDRLKSLGFEGNVAPR